MKDRECLACAEYKRCRDSYTSWFFFILGLIATISIRIVTVLMHLNPIYGKVAWYTGVGGFFIFFLYKYRVNTSRARFVEERRLVEKINNQRKLEEEDYRLVSAILCGISSKKDRINYLFIFGLSLLAIVLALYFDLFR